MTKEQKLAALTRWQQAMEQADATIGPVIGLLQLQPESPVCGAVWRLQRLLTDMTAELVGDQAEWLDWYAYENDMGHKGFEAGPVDATREIRTLDDLLWLIDTNGKKSMKGDSI